MPKCEVLPLLHFKYDEAKKLGIELGWAKLSLSWDWILKFVPQMGMCKKIYILVQYYSGSGRVGSIFVEINANSAKLELGLCPSLALFFLFIKLCMIQDNPIDHIF